MKTLITALLISSFVWIAPAQAEQARVDLSPVTAFAQVIHVPAVSVAVPTVVAVPLATAPVHTSVLVQDTETGVYVGALLYQKQLQTAVPLTLSSVPSRALTTLTDNRYDSSVEFPVSDEGENKVTISIDAAAAVTTSQIQLQLASYVALPQSVSLKVGTMEHGVLQTVIATRPLTGTTITFPEVTATHFELTFTYAQPLRIAELRLIQDGGTETKNEVRFLAKPQHAYDIYIDPDRVIEAYDIESGNLTNDVGVVTLSAQAPITNVYYVPADVDEDGVRDLYDNCVQVPNADQEDIDGNGRGDACDDFDRDGRLNYQDNCVDQPNHFQDDEDGDGIGDACDSEESRFTERNPWIPWVGMGAAAIVLLFLFVAVARQTKTVTVTKETGTPTDDSENTTVEK